jgi:hypothetical protein
LAANRSFGAFASVAKHDRRRVKNGDCAIASNHPVAIGVELTVKEVKRTLSGRYREKATFPRAVLDQRCGVLRGVGVLDRAFCDGGSSSGFAWVQRCSFEGASLGLSVWCLSIALCRQAARVFIDMFTCIYM